MRVRACFWRFGATARTLRPMPQSPPLPQAVWAALRVKETLARCLKAVELQYRLEADERLRAADARRRAGQ